MVMVSSESRTRVSRSRAAVDARAAHDPSCRHVDAHIEAPEVVVELCRPEIHLGVPAPEVVVLGEAGEPLGGLEQGVCPALGHPVPSAVVTAGELGVPGHLQGRRGAWGDGLHQGDLGHGLVHALCGQARLFVPTGRCGVHVHGLAVHRDGGDHHALCGLGRHGEAQRNPWPEEVVIQAQHDTGEFRRAVVVDQHRLLPCDGLRRGVEASGDRVVRLELPVVGAGGARGVPRACLHRLPDRVGDGDVPADGALGGGSLCGGRGRRNGEGEE